MERGVRPSMELSRLALRFAISTLALMLAGGCRSAAPKAANTLKPTGPVHENVLVIINENSKDSVEIGNYYIAKRNIPAKSVLRVKCEDSESFKDWKSFSEGLFYPLRAYLDKGDNRTRIDYIVLTKGIPFGGLNESVDQVLGIINTFETGTIQTPNPFFDAKEPFSSKKYGFYLVTRLDGYDAQQAKRLVDLSLKAKPRKGLFILDQDPTRNTGGYQAMNRAMEEAAKSLKERGFEVLLDTGANFVGWQKEVMGYISWGSNDKFYSRLQYKSNSFAPGAIAETVVSTSARTFKHATEGQSLIADLIESGVTGVKGYYGEPTLAAMAWPQILFDRYTRGWNLADSFYAASRFIRWRDIVVGDPLCAPYAKTSEPTDSKPGK